MAIFNKKVKQEVQEEEDVNVLKEIIGMILYIAVVVLLIYLFITYVGQRTEVDGGSMNSTLSHGESLWINKLAYRMGEPERFDIVVFPVNDSSVYYVKRIIGMPGETVSIDEEGHVLINGEILDDPYDAELIDEYHRGRLADGGEVTLGADEYFVMGDNRNNSLDSRDEMVGNITRKRLEGKVVLRMWPLDVFGPIPKPEEE